MQNMIAHTQRAADSRCWQQNADSLNSDCQTLVTPLKQKNQEVFTRYFPSGLASMNYELTIWGDRKTSKWLKTTLPFHQHLREMWVYDGNSIDSAAQNQASAHKHFTSCKAYSQLSCEECQRFQTPDPEVAGSVAIFIVFQEQCKTGRTNGEKPLEMLISVISVDQNLLSRLRKLWEKVLRIKHT